MTPLERAARAIADNPVNWLDYVPQARAVIEAIREPSAQMIDAMYDEYQGGGKGSLRDCWFEAIDTLLEEGA